MPKRGHSHTTERIDLVARLLQLFPRTQIAYLTAEREFVGRVWIKYLLKQPVPFRSRIRQSDRLGNGRGKAIKARVLFAELPPEQMSVLPKRRRLWGHWVYVAALRLQDGQLLVVVTSESPEAAIADDAKRWDIETLFGCLKRRGFCLESTHLCEAVREASPIGETPQQTLSGIDPGAVLGLSNRGLVDLTQALEAQKARSQS